MKNMLLETVGKVICLNGEKTVAEVSSTTDREIKLVSYFALRKLLSKTLKTWPFFFYYVANLGMETSSTDNWLNNKISFYTKSTQSRLKTEILRLDLEKNTKEETITLDLPRLKLHVFYFCILQRSSKKKIMYLNIT